MQLDGSASLPFFSGFSTVKLYMWVVAVFIVEMPPLWRRIVWIDLYTKEFVGSVLVFVEVRLDWDTQKVLVLYLHLNFSSDVGCNCWVERTGSSFHLKSTSRGSLGWGGLQVLCLCEVLICRSLGQPLFTVLLPQPFFSPSPPLIPLFTAVLYRTFFFPWPFRLQCYWMVLLPWYSCSPHHCYVYFILFKQQILSLPLSMS